MNCLFVLCLFFNQRQSASSSSPSILGLFPAAFSPFTQEGAGAHGTAHSAGRLGSKKRQKSGLGAFQVMAPALPAQGFRYSACTPDAETQREHINPSWCPGAWDSGLTWDRAIGQLACRVWSRGLPVGSGSVRTQGETQGLLVRRKGDWGDGTRPCIFEGLCLEEKLGLFHEAPAAEPGPMKDIDREGVKFQLNTGRTLWVWGQHGAGSTRGLWRKP